MRNRIVQCKMFSLNKYARMAADTKLFLIALSCLASDDGYAPSNVETICNEITITRTQETDDVVNWITNLIELGELELVSVDDRELLRITGWNTDRSLTKQSIPKDKKHDWSWSNTGTSVREATGDKGKSYSSITGSASKENTDGAVEGDEDGHSDSRVPSRRRPFKRVAPTRSEPSRHSDVDTERRTRASRGLATRPVHRVKENEDEGTEDRGRRSGREGTFRRFRLARPSDGSRGDQQDQEAARPSTPERRIGRPVARRPEGREDGTKTTVRAEPAEKPVERRLRRIPKPTTQKVLKKAPRPSERASSPITRDGLPDFRARLASMGFLAPRANHEIREGFNPDKYMHLERTQLHELFHSQTLTKDEMWLVLNLQKGEAGKKLQAEAEQNRRNLARNPKRKFIK